MREYTPGMRVIIRDEEWMIQKVEENTLGNKALHVIGISPLVRDREAVFLSDLEIDKKGNSLISVVDPAKVKLIPDNSPFNRKTQLYVESQWRKAIPTDNKIHIGNKAAMDSMDYQLLPAKIALSELRPRILIADAVGLGKTLEAGILMSELIARGKGKRILVVTVSSMMTQFQKEMWNRFTIPLVRLDSARIQRIKAELPTNYNPFFYYDKAIISIDTLKRDVEYRTHLEKAHWDIIVIDEAQNVAERGGGQSQRARLAKLLADKSDALILLSATPHDGSSRSFASLMNMLDPTAIADPDKYTADDIEGLFVRRFKKDITQGSFLERNITIERCTASIQEEKAYDVFTEMKLDMDTSHTGRTGMLFKTSLEKSLFSSPAACIKSVEERLQKLRKKYSEEQIRDISNLEKLKKVLLEIEPEDFTRYQRLLDLLNSREYGWDKKAKDDRIVIFTERIETMKYLADHLRADLRLKDEQVVSMSGSMSDTDQQKIVDDFGRLESPIRILVASDVASEGLNLHYYSHRLIHFDIPWSFMVFQQRNGRIDRYGQKKKPDIRFMKIESNNEKIKGDVRILEILIEKEKQAINNIGDPAVLLGKFDANEEELVVANVIESGSNAKRFENELEKVEKAFDPLEFLLGQAEATSEKAEVSNDHTLFTDLQYVEAAMEFLNRNKEDAHSITKLGKVSGVEIKVSDDMRRRLRATMPEEALPKEGYIKLSDDKAFCMQDMINAQQNSLDENSWPATQYLWKEHPILDWINGKIGLLIKRDEVPVMSTKNLRKGTSVFVVNGSEPNERSTPLVDKWFGIEYVNGEFENILDMNEVIEHTGINSLNNPNTGETSSEKIAKTEGLLEDVIKQAKKVLHKDYLHYQAITAPKIDEEIDKLESLRKRQKAYQLSLFEDNTRKRGEAQRKVDEIFDSFVDYVKESLTIKDNPYIRIIAVVMGE